MKGRRATPLHRVRAVQLSPAATGPCDGSTPASTIMAVQNERDDGPLTATDRDLLDFEGQRWKYPGAKEAAVRDRFGWPMTTYLVRLNALLDRPAAAAYAPVLVGRLRRLRELRRQARPVRRHGTDRP